MMASALLLAVVFVFDLTAFGLAVAAEQRRNTVRLRLSLSLIFFILFELFEMFCLSFFFFFFFIFL